MSTTPRFCTNLPNNPGGAWDLDGPAIRDANRGDSRESICRKKQNPIFIPLERFARIASNLQFAVLNAAIHKKRGFSSRTSLIVFDLRIDSHESGHLKAGTSWQIPGIRKRRNKKPSGSREATDFLIPTSLHGGPPPRRMVSGAHGGAASGHPLKGVSEWM